LTEALKLPSADRINLIEVAFPHQPLMWDELLTILDSYSTATVSRRLDWSGGTTFGELVPSLPRPDAHDREKPLLTLGTSYGPYRVVKALPAGGMSQVFLADDVRLGRRVAVKSLAGKWLASPIARQRLMREARSAAALTHPNIATLYDVFEDGQRLLLVMEYVEGRSLRALLD
jgi:serine/threonine protein kinase